jgi:hypothetical protein
LYQTLSEADHSLAEAEEAVERTSDLGMIVIEEENMLAEAVPVSSQPAPRSTLSIWTKYSKKVMPQ